MQLKGYLFCVIKCAVHSNAQIDEMRPTETFGLRDVSIIHVSGWYTLTVYQCQMRAHSMRLR